MKDSNSKPRRVCVAVSHPDLKPCARVVAALFRALDAAFRPAAPAGELSVALMTDAEICALHARFLSDATPTDVITFDGDGSDFGGEICVSVDCAARTCERFGNDFSTELALYLVHGYLHLAGFDDHESDDIAAMRAAEKKALAILRERGALPRFDRRHPLV